MTMYSVPRPKALSCTAFELPIAGSFCLFLKFSAKFDKFFMYCLKMKQHDHDLL